MLRKNLIDIFFNIYSKEYINLFAKEYLNGLLENNEQFIIENDIKEEISILLEDVLFFFFLFKLYF